MCFFCSRNPSAAWTHPQPSQIFLLPSRPIWSRQLPQRQAKQLSNTGSPSGTVSVSGTRNFVGQIDAGAATAAAAGPSCSETWPSCSEAWPARVESEVPRSATNCNSHSLNGKFYRGKNQRILSAKPWHPHPPFNALLPGLRQLVWQRNRDLINSIWRICNGSGQVQNVSLVYWDIVCTSPILCQSKQICCKNSAPYLCKWLSIFLLLCLLLCTRTST